MSINKGALVFLYSGDLVVMQRKDWTHPRSTMRHKLCGLGGIVEDGEDPITTIMRELTEELPGIEFSFVSKSSPFVFSEGGGWSCTAYAFELKDFDLASRWRELVRACEEGTIEIWRREQLVYLAMRDFGQFLPGIDTAVINFFGSENDKKAANIK